MKLITIALASLAVSACASAPISGDLSIALERDGYGFRVEDYGAATPLIKSRTDLGSVTVSGQKVSFKTTSFDRKSISDEFGRGTCFIYNGQSTSGPEISRTLRLYVYEAFPSTIVLDALYCNASGDTLTVDGWSMCDLQVQAEAPQSYFWSFQGQSSAAREDWLKQVGEEFYQRNYMGMNSVEGHADYGGGIPVVCLWRRDAGVIIGHLEPTPQLVSLPVDKKAGNDYAEISLVKEFANPVKMAPGETVSTCKCFIGIYKGDCFGALRSYAGLLDRVGVKMPVSVPEAYETAWCAWGYERRFTIAEIVGTLPKVKELGFKWATLDDGFQIAEGDWDLTPERFPHGDADMKYMVDEFHKYGLKAELWWAPLCADPGTEFLRKYPDALILDEKGKPHNIEWWDSWYLSPVDEDVRREQSALVHKFIADYGFDGLKLDGQHMNCVAPDYNPRHHPQDPEKSCRELPTFYKLIQETAQAVKPNAVIQYCPCGDCFSVYNLPYTGKAVSSDPKNSWQIRTKGYVLRALAPRLAYYGDHIELSDGGNDYPTQLGIGAVIGTKFTWPKDNPYAEQSYLLTPEKEALLKNALEIYEDKQLARGQYVPGLYDIGFDYPETHVLTQNGKLYYAFYTKDEPVSSVELRGLKPGKTYKVEDYYNHRDLGTIKATGKTVLRAEVDGSLLLEVSEVPSE